MKKEIDVLYVEDNPGYVFLVNEILTSETLNFNIKHEELLQSAVEEVKNKKFDVVILDLGLPDSKGIETFEKMKSTLNGTPVLVFSSNDDEFLMNDILKKGAVDYIVKGSDKMFKMNKRIENILAEKD